ncbi:MULTISPECIES: acyl carrier protein [Haloarcula]|uniref:Carrier domain-containing protein n=1 Tax=Haloarcula pellucida TaxID=1427151 RepID=A0A830GMN4_9EURY|nr:MULTISPECIES: phosphopantetheine-binding protein [Halomicroarcula]MBX0349936.1 hypothetical protein [Halomicroarcula pellucida]MDS0279684.1 phosphopantetheine-binding protein [Halomicroarcula sp. S1AR25-4]GGN95076.1 hypothetical protein GCM10009030_22120 [Halomicroarcula pellucida]
MQSTAADQIESIISNRLHVEESGFDDETVITGEKLDAESLDIVEIAEAIDGELGVYLTVDDIEEMQTVGDLKSFVASELEGN